MDLVKQELIKKRLEINYKIKIFTKLLKEHEDNIEIKKVFIVFIYDLRKERKILNYSILNYDYIKHLFHI
jgi:hypothetical protein|tara:strand:- start:8170 stop:8379 length:210 start_codon:yes stop_codon:yes gene_type:complete